MCRLFFNNPISVFCGMDPDPGPIFSWGSDSYPVFVECQIRFLLVDIGTGFGFSLGFDSDKVIS